MESVANRRAKLHAIHTACGIETPLTLTRGSKNLKLHAIHTACGIETAFKILKRTSHVNCMQSIPLAVLKLKTFGCARFVFNCMQSIPLAVLKQPKQLVLADGLRIACNPYRLRY